MNRVPGEFMVVFTRSLYSNEAVFEYPEFNLSHVFGRLRFGPKIYTTTTPLDGIAVLQGSHEPVEYVYNAMCTAVVLTRNEKELIAKSYEYVVYPTVSPALPDGRPPGIYVTYQFTPYTVMVNFRMREALEMIPTVLAAVAGAYVIAMLIDSMLYNQSTQTPIE